MEIVERRTFLIGKVVGGDVLGAIFDRPLEIEAPVRQILPGDGEHQIDVDVSEAAPPRERNGFGGLRLAL